jgi:hypothetical protein
LKDRDGSGEVPKRIEFRPNIIIEPLRTVERRFTRPGLKVLT